MYLEVCAIFIINIFGCCYIYIQTVEPAFTNCSSCVNFTVCGIFESALFYKRELPVSNQMAPSV